MCYINALMKIFLHILFFSDGDEDLFEMEHNE